MYTKRDRYSNWNSHSKREKRIRYRKDLDQLRRYSPAPRIQVLCNEWAIGIKLRIRPIRQLLQKGAEHLKPRFITRFCLQRVGSSHKIKVLLNSYLYLVSDAGGSDDGCSAEDLSMISTGRRANYRWFGSDPVDKFDGASISLVLIYGDDRLVRAAPPTWWWVEGEDGPPPMYQTGKIVR